MSVLDYLPEGYGIQKGTTAKDYAKRVRDRLNKPVDLVLNDGTNLGKVTSFALDALQNGTIDNYVPTTEWEKKTLNGYQDYLNNQIVEIENGENKPTIKIRYGNAKRIDNAFEANKNLDNETISKAAFQAFADLRLSGEEYNNAYEYLQKKKSQFGIKDEKNKISADSLSNESKALVSSYTTKELYDMIQSNLKKIGKLSAGLTGEAINASEIAELKKKNETLEQARAFQQQTDDEKSERKYNSLVEKKDFGEKSASIDNNDFLRDSRVLIASEPETAAKIMKSRKDNTPYSISTADPFLMKGKYAFMTEDERKKFRYLVNTEGIESGNQYLDSLERKLNERSVKNETNAIREASKSHPILTSAATLLNATGAGAVSSGIGVLSSKQKEKETGRVEPLDPNADSFGITRAAETVRSSVSEELNWWQNLLYQGGMAIGDVLVSSMLAKGIAGAGTNGGLAALNAAAKVTGSTSKAAKTFQILDNAAKQASLGIMSSNAAASAAYDVASRGGSARQAIARGTEAALIEYATEMIGIDNLFRIANEPAKTWGNAVKEVLKQSGAEGLEETVSEILNNISDQKLMGAESNYNTEVERYQKSGYSEKDAKNKAFFDLYIKNPLYSGAVGAISGAGLGTAATMKGTADIKKAQTSYGKLIQETESDYAVILTGMESGKDTESYRIANKLHEKLQSGKKITPREIGDLYLENVKTIQEEEGNRSSAPKMESSDETVLKKPAVPENFVKENGQEIPASSDTDISANHFSDSSRGNGMISPEAETKSESMQQRKDTNHLFTGENEEILQAGDVPRYAKTKNAEQFENQLISYGVTDTERKNILATFEKFEQGAKSAGINVNAVSEIAVKLNQAAADELQGKFGKVKVGFNGNTLDLTMQILAEPDTPLTEHFVNAYANVWADLWEKSNSMSYNSVKKYLNDNGMDGSREHIAQLLTEYSIAKTIDGDMGNTEIVSKSMFGKMVEAFKGWLSHFVENVSALKNKIWKGAGRPFQEQAIAFSKGDWSVVLQNSSPDVIMGKEKNGTNAEVNQNGREDFIQKPRTAEKDQKAISDERDSQSIDRGYDRRGTRSIDDRKNKRAEIEGNRSAERGIHEEIRVSHRGKFICERLTNEAELSEIQKNTVQANREIGFDTVFFYGTAMAEESSGFTHDVPDGTVIGNTIYISKDSKNNPFEISRHESVHGIKRIYPDLYEKLHDAVFPHTYVVQFNNAVNDYIEKSFEAYGQEVGYDIAEEELLCNLSYEIESDHYPDFVANREAIQKAYAEFYRDFSEQKKITSSSVTAQTESANQNNKNLEQVKKEIARYSKLTGVKTAWYNEKTRPDRSGANGFYENETIYINEEAENPYVEVFKHELFHSFDGAEKQAVIDFFKKHVVKDTDAFRKFKTEEITAQKQFNPRYGESDFWEEYAAQNAEFLLDERFIEQLVKTDRNLAQRILDAIKEMIRKVRRVLSAETEYFNDKIASHESGKVSGLTDRQLTEAKKLYANALWARKATSSAQNTNRNERFSLKKGGSIRTENGVQIYTDPYENDYHVIDSGKSYRYYKGDIPMSNWGHAMFADNPESVTGYGDKCWTVNKEDLTSFDDIKELIMRVYEEDREDGFPYFYNWSESDKERFLEMDLSEPEAFAEQFNPPDIVDFADGYDHEDFNGWFMERIAEPNGIKGVKTQDGAVVFDESIIQREPGGDDNKDSYVEWMSREAIKKMYDYDVPDYQTTKFSLKNNAEKKNNFSQQIDNWISGKMKPEEIFLLGDTPKVLQDIGSRALPVVMSQGVMKKITGGKHDISIDEIRNLPNAIAEPIMIFQSATVPNAYVILTELPDKNGNDVVVAMHLNRAEGFNKVNRIASVYGKYNIANFVQKQIQLKNLKYIDKNKSSEWLRSRGLQLPKLNTIPNSNNNIPQKEDTVNNNVSNEKKKDTKTSLKRSKFYESIQESEVLDAHTKQEVKEHKTDFYYQGISNEQTMKKALAAVEKNAASETAKFLSMENKRATLEDISKGFILLKQYQDSGDYESAVEIAKKLSKVGTEAGRNVQIYSILERLTPEGMLKYATSELEKVKEVVAKEKGKAWMEKYGEKFDLTEEEAKQITDTMIRVQNMPDGRDKMVMLAEIQKLIQHKIPSSLGSKFASLQRISLLLNPKTVISRNALSNLLINPIFTASDFVASGIDRAVSTKTGLRTTGMPNYKLQLQGVKKGFFDSYDDFRRGVNTRDIEADNFKIGKAPAFKNKVLSTLDRTVGYLLDAGDRPFFEGYFLESLNGQMKANGVTVPTNSMIDIARQTALEKTWQDTNIVTRSANKVRNGLNFGKDFGLGSIIVPFVKTPSNIAKAIVEFSPVGFAKGLLWDGTVLMKAVQSGTVTPKLQRRFVNNMGKGIAGMMMYLIGMILASAGITTGSDEEKDKDIRNFKRNILGILPNSIRFGEKSYSYDWAQPIGGILTTTADIQKGIVDKDNFINTVTQALAMGGNTLFEQSMLQGISEFFGSYDGFMTSLARAIVESPTQFIPTFGKQIAEMLDPVARRTQGNGLLDTAINKAKARIPGATKSLEPVVDVLGRDVHRYGGKNSLFNIFLNPSNVNIANPTETTKEVWRLYEQVGDKEVFPKVAPQKFTDDGKEYKMTPTEQTQFQRTMGQETEKALSDLINSYSYQEASDEKKSEKVKSVISKAQNKAKAEIIESRGEKVSKKLKKAAG